jgi:hypothetical protein
MIIHKSRLIVAVNQRAIDNGVNVGSFCWDSFCKLKSIPDADKAFFLETGKPSSGNVRCTFCRAEEALAFNQEVVKNHHVERALWETHWKPVGHNCYLHFATELIGNA